MFICLDFETFFDSKGGYTLRKMTTEAYVRDPRFAAHGCAMFAPEWISKEVQWYPAEQLPGLFSSIPWSRVTCLAHHAQFDGLILSHHYRVRPMCWLCSLSMARLLMGNHLRVGLDSLAGHFNLPNKTVPYKEFDGVPWHQMSTDLRQRLAAGAIHDVELTVEIFHRHLLPCFPASEYPLVDATIRMFTEPVLRADPVELTAVEQTEQAYKHELLARAGVTDAAELRSEEAFATLLRELEIEPVTKQGRRGDIYAFAATDPFMEDLLGSSDPAIVALAEARLAVQSSLKETRTRRLIEMARRGPLCMYLNYAGAATTRWSGGDKINPQNLIPEIEACIQAPEGQDLIVIDASQIECRLLNYMAGQTDVIERFRRKEDPYCAVASMFFNYQVTKGTFPRERQVGKVLELQAGYGSGGDKIRRTLRIDAGLILDYAAGMRARDAYRVTHPHVVNYWRQADNIILMLARGRVARWGPLRIADGCLWLPNDAPLIYDTLRFEPGTGWLVARRSGEHKLYGAKLVENVIQALARVFIGEIMNKALAQGLHIALMRHDDIVVAVDKDSAQDVLAWLTQIMREPPAWAPGLPLDCEGHIGGRLHAG